MTHVTRIRMFGLVALLIALAAGCGGSGSTYHTSKMASVSDCLREHGARAVRSEAPVNQDPDIGMLMDGYLGTISGSFKRFGFTVFVTDTAAYASGVEGALDPTAQRAIAPCVSGFDPGP